MFNLFSKYTPTTGKEHYNNVENTKYEENVLNIDNWKLKKCENEEYERINKYFEFLETNIHEYKYRKFIQDNFYALLEKYYLPKPEDNLNLGGLFCKTYIITHDCINSNELIKYIQSTNINSSHKVSTLIYNIIDCILKDSTSTLWNKYKNIILNYHIGFLHQYKSLEKFLTEELKFLKFLCNCLVELRKLL